MKKRKRLGEMLMEAKLISDFQLAVACGRQKMLGTRLGVQLVKLGFVSEEDIAYVLEQQLGIKWISLKDISISAEVLSLVKADIAVKYNIVPIHADKKRVIIAMTEPTDITTIDTLGFMLARQVEPVIATVSHMQWAIDKYYRGITEPKSADTGRPAEKDEAPPVADFADALRREAYVEGLVETLVDILAEKGIIDKKILFERLVRNKK